MLEFLEVRAGVFYSLWVTVLLLFQLFQKHVAGGEELSTAGSICSPSGSAACFWAQSADPERTAPQAAGPQGPAGRFWETGECVESSSELAQGTPGAGQP